MSLIALRSRHLLPIFFAVFMCWAAPMAQAYDGRPYNPRFKRVGQEVGLPENLIFCLAQDSLGYLWVGSSQGLFRHDGTQSQRFFPPQAGVSSLQSPAPDLNPHRPSVMSLCVDSLHRLWVGTPEGLYSLDMATGILQPFILRTSAGQRVQSEVRALLRDKAGRLWIATYRQGLFRLSKDRSSLDHFQADSCGLPSEAVLSLMEDAKGQIYVGTRQGLALWNEETADFTCIYDKLWGPSANQDEVLSIAQGPDGRIWLATWSGGLKTFIYNSQGQAQVVPVTRASHIFNTRVVHALPDGFLLVGTLNGLYRMDPRTDEIQRMGGPGNQHALEDQNIRCLFTDSAKGLWVGTYGGGLQYLISHIGVDFYTRDTQYNRMTGIIVRDMVSQGEDYLWIATEDGGLNCFNPRHQHFQHAGPVLRLRHHNVQALLIDGDNAYVGYDAQGADRVDLRTGTVTQFPQVPLDKPGHRVNKFFKDHRENLYAGTDQGLCRWDPRAGGFLIVDSLTAHVQDICEDIEGNLWVATQSQGAICFPASGGAPRHYNTRNGGSPSDSLITCFSDPGGHLWMGSSGAGLLRYDPLDNALQSCKTQLPQLDDRMVYALKDDHQGRIWFSTETGIRCLNPRLMTLVYHFTPERGLPIHRFSPRAVYRDTYGRIFFGGMNGFCVMDIPHLREERPALSVHIQDFKPLMADSLLHERCRAALRKPGTPIVLPRGVQDFDISYIAPEFDMPGNVSYSYKLSPSDSLWQRADNRTLLSFTRVPPGKYDFKLRAYLHSGIPAEAPTLHIEIRRAFMASRFMQALYLLLGGLVLTLLWRNRNRFKAKNTWPHLAKKAAPSSASPAPASAPPASLYRAPLPDPEVQSEALGELHPDNKLMVGVRTEKDQFIGRLEKLIEEKLPDPELSIVMLAQALHMSQSKLQRKIKDLYGTTPTDYIRSLRLQKAKSLMDAGVKKVKDVCAPVGFSSSSYFAKCFIQKYGISPGDYIQQVSSADSASNPEPSTPEASEHQE